MTKLKEIYKCEICGNIVEVLYNGNGELVCCGKPMVLQIEKFKDAGDEKHLPILEKKGNVDVIRVGEVPHPMEKEHYIEWIEVIFNGRGSYRVFLKPGELAECELNFINEIKEVRAFCNIHGLWKNNIS